jgi:peptidyl-prolyl cis-trans isomerase B (cyclophilin B)
VSTNQQRREAAKRKLERQQERRAQRVRHRKRISTIVAVAVVIVVIGGLAALTFDGGGKPATPAAAVAAPATAPSGPCTFRATPDELASRPVSAPTNPNPPRQGTVTVSVTTNQGVLPITLNRAMAPCTVENFLNLTKAGFYNNTPCHRLVTGDSLKALQCGDPTGTGTGGPGYTIPDEPPTGLQPGPDGASIYPTGTVAMAKTSAPNSGGSQFFLVYANSELPPDYTIFGTIASSGVQVLQKIASAGGNDSSGPGDGKPNLPTSIQSVTASQ